MILVFVSVFLFKINTMNILSDEYFMKEAFKEAKKAFENGEVPVGAIIVSNNTIIARAYNQVEMLKDPTAHAEILAITSATNHLGSKYLDNCTMYVTLEPCLMCASATNWAKIDKIIYGAEDNKNGFMICGKSVLHPKTKLEFGLMGDKSGELLKDFFLDKR
jgi:tRNA(adenine34) deaminase